MQDIGLLVVPKWYRDARARGESEEALKRRIVDFHDASAKRRGVSSASLSAEAVALTYDAYEYALAKGRA